MKPHRAILIREVPSERTDWFARHRVIFVRKADKYYIATFQDGNPRAWWYVYRALPDGTRESFWWIDRGVDVASRIDMLRAIQASPKL